MTFRLRHMLGMYLIQDPFQLWEILKTKSGYWSYQMNITVITLKLFKIMFLGFNYENKTYTRLSSLKSGWRFSRGNKDLKSIPILKNTAAISDNDGIQGQTGESLKVSS